MSLTQPKFSHPTQNNQPTTRASSSTRGRTNNQHRQSRVIQSTTSTDDSWTTVVRKSQRRRPQQQRRRRNVVPSCSPATRRTPEVFKVTKQVPAAEARHIIGKKGRTIAELQSLAQPDGTIKIIGQREDATRTLIVTSTLSQQRCDALVRECTKRGRAPILYAEARRQEALKQAEERRKAQEEAEKVRQEQLKREEAKRKEVEQRRALMAEKKALEAEQAAKLEAARALKVTASNAVVVQQQQVKIAKAAVATNKKLLEAERQRLITLSEERAQQLAKAESAAAKAEAVLRPKRTLQGRTKAMKLKKRRKAEEAQARANGTLDELLAQRTAKKQAQEAALELPEQLRREAKQAEAREQVALQETVQLVTTAEADLKAAEEALQQAKASAQEADAAITRCKVSVVPASFASVLVSGPLVPAKISTPTAISSNEHTITVASKDAGRLIGKQGSSIRGLKEQYSNASITIVGEPGEDKQVHIKAATPTEVEAVIKAIRTLCFPPQYVAPHRRTHSSFPSSSNERQGCRTLYPPGSHSERTITVAAKDSGRLIGKQGSSIRGLKEQFSNASITIVGEPGEDKQVRIAAATPTEVEAVIEAIRTLCFPPPYVAGTKRNVRPTTNGRWQTKPRRKKKEHREGPRYGKQDAEGRWWVLYKDGERLEFRKDTYNNKWYSRTQFVKFYKKKLRSLRLAVLRWENALPSKEERQRALRTKAKQAANAAAAAAYTGPKRELKFVNGTMKLMYVDDSGNILGPASTASATPTQPKPVSVRSNSTTSRGKTFYYKCPDVRAMVVDETTGRTAYKPVIVARPLFAQ